jgi:3-hydroxymyristoyl/3-hydroxydecanoyl-(acyl carrier protein) dehydratase
MSSATESTIPVVLPHGEKFRLLHRVTVVKEGGYVEGEYDYTGKAILHHADHFPGRVRMPGCDMIEGMAEAACQVAHALPEFRNCIFILAGVKDVEFLRGVSAGTILTYTAQVSMDETDPRQGFAHCTTEIRTPDEEKPGEIKVEPVANAILSFKVAYKPNSSR